MNCLLIAALLSLAHAYASLIATTNAPASVSNFYQDFASCSCDLTPGLCDNYCCCDTQCVFPYPLRTQQHGAQIISASPHPSPWKYPVDRHRVDLEPSLISPVFIFRIGASSATTSRHCSLPPSPTPSLPYCKSQPTQRISLHQ